MFTDYLPRGRWPWHADTESGLIPTRPHCQWVMMVSLLGIIKNILQIWRLVCGQWEQLVSAGHIARRVHQSQLCSLSFGLSCDGCSSVVVLASILSGGAAFFCSVSTQKPVSNAISWSDSYTLKVAFWKCDVRYALSLPLPPGSRWRGGLCEWRLLLSPNNSNTPGCLCTNVWGHFGLCVPVSGWRQLYLCASVCLKAHTDAWGIKKNWVNLGVRAKMEHARDDSTARLPSIHIIILICFCFDV